ncbi:MAG: ATP-binding cassette domain-containing protein [Catonella sp.]|nr:ATP-binding cassette domain-containing protein [Catonella sp.]MDY6355985.1 ATP-binding cassette domain-containing protein [Catonella sp.]
MRKWRLSDLRRRIGYVPQKNVLFTGDIASNLNFGDESGQEEDWKRAAEIACADEFIEKKTDRYHEHIAQGGTNLSGGQRQRLAIARAMACDPEIMILDEATSNVDTYTEQKIQDAMAKLMKGRTSFVIAHRLSTIRDADMILYMENGDIKEAGNHDELMARHGKYEQLYLSQFAS